MIPFVYEDRHLLIANKPAGTLSQPTTGKEKDSSIYGTILQQLKSKQPDEKKPFLRINHRLDKPVSGLMIFSKSSKATQRINNMFHSRQIQKWYLAIVCGKLVIDEVINSHLSRIDNAPERSEHGQQFNGKPVYQLSSTRFETLEHFVDSNPRHSSKVLTLLRIELLTGRKHQIRSQLAEIGHPIYNDYQYQSPYPLRVDDFPSHMICLHSYRLKFSHPVQTDRIIDLHSPPPIAWTEYFRNCSWNI